MTQENEDFWEGESLEHRTKRLNDKELVKIQHQENQALKEGLQHGCKYGYVWIAPYTRDDGIYVKGHCKKLFQW